MSTRRLKAAKSVSAAPDEFRGVSEWVPVGSLKENPNPTRLHSKKQKQQIAQSIKRRGFIKPLGVRSNIVFSGNACLAAAIELGMTEVPVVRLDHLSETEARAYAIDDNKLSDNSAFEPVLLTAEMNALVQSSNEGWDLFAGFEAAEIDNLFGDHIDPESDPADQLPETNSDTVTQLGDFWQLGQHRLVCGDAKSPDDVSRLMGKERAAVVFSDPPWNLPTRFFQGRGKIKHADFAEGYGEMSDAAFAKDFLTPVFKLLAEYSLDGSFHYICGDYRHIREFLDAGLAAYDEFNNLIVWNKTVPGLGNPYRSQHELVFLFKKGEAPHQNNIELGRHGRNRSNIWVFPGATSFGKGRLDNLAMHPTVKPVAMIVEVLKDASRRRDIVLDLFMGSGSTIMAAERVGRRAYGIEISPQFVDVAIRRWQDFTKRDAILLPTGQTFEEVMKVRSKAGRRPK